MGLFSPGTATSNHHDGVVIRPVFFSPRREGPLVGSLPATLAPHPRRAEGAVSLRLGKEFLARRLAERFLGKRLPDLTVARDPLGKPHLLVDGAPGPAVSFSWSEGRQWAAVGTSGGRLGLDAASPREFPGAYPRKRVFGEEEWQAAISLTAGKPAEAAALLWSAKEAVVKAQGCGFQFFGPLQVRMEFAGHGDGGLCWRARLDAALPGRDLPGTLEPSPVTSFRLDEVWLSVAWIPAPPQSAPIRTG